MEIRETGTRAKQGGRGRSILVVLLVSTFLAALGLWGIFGLWAGSEVRPEDPILQDQRMEQESPIFAPPLAPAPAD